jgi:TonB family protein
MIAYGMLYTAAVGIPIALAAIALSAVLRRHGKPERLVWLGALVTAFVLPVVALLDPFGGQAAAPPLPETGVIGLPAVLVVPSEGSALQLGELLMAAWLLASGVLAVRWAVAAIRLARSSRSWRSGTLDGVPVWRTEKLGPAVAGTFRMRVLVPGWLDTLPAGQRSLILLHEQEHIRARDPILIALSRMMRILVPWNPIVWFLSARLVRAVELDCDRRVLARSADVATYGRTLLTVSERRPGRLVAVAAFAESEAPLRSRILAMTTPSRTISVVALLTSMVLGVGLLLGALQVPVPASAAGADMVDPGAGAEPTRGALGAAEELVADPTPDATAAPDAPAAAAATSEARTSDTEATSATDVIRTLRSEVGAGRSSAEPEDREPSPNEVAAGLPGPQRQDLGDTPRFTPYTVAPQILNRDEVVAAMVREYPTLLRDAGIGGTVRVYFFIRENGTVGNILIDLSSGHQALDDAALAVASVYRFSPAMNRMQRVPVWVSFPITFQVR